MKTTTLLLGMTLAALFQTGARANIIADPGFEAISNSAIYGYNPSDPSWTFSGNSGFVKAGSPFGNPTPVGTYSAFLQFNPNQSSTSGVGFPGNISQTINVATPGIYSLSLLAASRNGNTSGFSITIDGSTVPLFQEIVTSLSFMTINETLSLTAGTHTISFAALALNGGDTTTFLDNVSLSPAVVPTPGSMTLMGIGAMISTGVLARRSRRDA